MTLYTKDARVHLSNDIMKGGIDDVVPVNPHDIVSDGKVLKSKISNFIKRSTFLYNITPESNIKFTEKKGNDHH